MADDGVNELSFCLSDMYVLFLLHIIPSTANDAGACLYDAVSWLIWVHSSE